MPLKSTDIGHAYGIVSKLTYPRPASWLLAGFVHREIFLYNPVGTTHLLASRFNGWNLKWQESLEKSGRDGRYNFISRIDNAVEINRYRSCLRHFVQSSVNHFFQPLMVRLRSPTMAG